MSNVIDWLRASGEFMAKDRPDIYPTPQVAVEELSTLMDSMREDDLPMIGFTSYQLIRFVDMGGEEWLLTRKIATVVTDFEKISDSAAWGWTAGSGVLKYGVEGLPDILDEGLDF